MKKPIVKQIEGKEIPVEILATSIRDIAQGIRALRKSPLNDKALVLLIQHAIPTRGGGRPVSQKEIKAVFEAIDKLETTYLKKR